MIYARVSSIGDRQNTERQVSELSAQAKQKGLSIEKVYEEHVSGAKKNIDRPVLTECLDYCKSQHIGILLVSELSRLGRNTFEVLSTVKDLMDCGINVYFQKEQMYLLDQNGKPGMFTPILLPVPRWKGRTSGSASIQDWPTTRPKADVSEERLDP